MNKLSKICMSLLLFMLIVSVILGLFTKKSFVSINENEAVVEQHILNVNADVVNELNYEKIIKNLEKAKVAFVVTAIESEVIHQATKTVANVDKVLKGDKELTGKDIVLYDDNYISYRRETNKYTYRCMSNISNSMQPNKTYLIFADKIDYSELYAETLIYERFKVNTDYVIYSFPLDTVIEPIEVKDKLTYGDIKNYDYICFNEESADKLEQIKNSVLDEYLTEK